MLRPIYHDQPYLTEATNPFRAIRLGNRENLRKKVELLVARRLQHGLRLLSVMHKEGRRLSFGSKRDHRRLDLRKPVESTPTCDRPDRIEKLQILHRVTTIQTRLLNTASVERRASSLLPVLGSHESFDAGNQFSHGGVICDAVIFDADVELFLDVIQQFHEIERVESES